MCGSSVALKSTAKPRLWRLLSSCEPPSVHSDRGQPTSVEGMFAVPSSCSTASSRVAASSWRISPVSLPPRLTFRRRLKWAIVLASSPKYARISCRKATRCSGSARNLCPFTKAGKSRSICLIESHSASVPLRSISLPPLTLCVSSKRAWSPPQVKAPTAASPAAAAGATPGLDAAGVIHAVASRPTAAFFFAFGPATLAVPKVRLRSPRKRPETANGGNPVRPCARSSTSVSPPITSSMWRSVPVGACAWSVAFARSRTRVLAHARCPLAGASSSARVALPLTDRRPVKWTSMSPSLAFGVSNTTASPGAAVRRMSIGFGARWSVRTTPPTAALPADCWSVSSAPGSPAGARRSGRICGARSGAARSAVVVRIGR